MEPSPALTRRHVLVGIGGIMAMTLAGGGAHALGPDTDLTLGALEFRPEESNVAYETVVGGVRATGGGTFFQADLRLPVGSRILKAWVFLNPNGAARTVSLRRYRPLNPAVQVLAIANSTNGTDVEAIVLAVTHDVSVKWNYHIALPLFAGPGAAILYGARIKYQPPA